MPIGLNSDAIAGAAARADARLRTTIADLFLPDDLRLDDRVRIAVKAALNRLIASFETDMRRHAARLLAAGGQADAAEAMLVADQTALPVLIKAGLLRDSELMEELVARTRGELIADALPATVGEANRPSLLVRLADLPDRVVATAAHALLAAENASDGRGGLPAELQHRVVWWVAAAIRSMAPVDAASDRALVQSAQRRLAAHDEGERPEAIADRLVAAIDPLPAEVPALLIEALGDRRLTLVVALLAWALSIDGEVARALLVEPDDDRLWLALRAAGLSREDIARVALALAQADPRRDIEAFADRLDEIDATTAAVAREAISDLAMPRELRVAVRELAAGRR